MISEYWVDKLEMKRTVKVETVSVTNFADGLTAEHPATPKQY